MHKSLLDMYVQILTDAALLKRQRREIEELRAKLRVCIKKILFNLIYLNMQTLYLCP